MDVLSCRALVEKWMRDHRLSQSQAATRLRMPRIWLRRFLLGTIHQPRTKTISRIAAALGVPREVIEVAIALDIARAAADRLEIALEAAESAGLEGAGAGQLVARIRD